MAKTTLLDRIRAEQPGLRLTCSQATRLWGVDAPLCGSLLGLLVDDGFLELKGGYYTLKNPKPKSKPK